MTSNGRAGANVSRAGKGSTMIAVPVLTGAWVQLEPLASAHREELRRAADDERIWQHTLVVARGSGFDAWFDDTLAQQDTGRQVPFAVRRLADHELVGSTSYLDPSPRHQRIEIGATWYNPAVWGTRVNAERKLLLLTHAFEALGMNRVSFVTDIRNTRSQAAIAKLGAVREGVLRGHMVTQGDVLGARHADMGGFILEPAHPLLNRFALLYQRLLVHNGAHPLAGRQQLRWLREAGFTRPEASATYDCWTKSPDQTRRTVQFLANLLGDSSFARQLVVAGIADRATLEQTREAFLRWGTDPDAFAAEAWAEAVALKP